MLYSLSRNQGRYLVRGCFVGLTMMLAWGAGLDTLAMMADAYIVRSIDRSLHRSRRAIAHAIARLLHRSLARSHAPLPIRSLERSQARLVAQTCSNAHGTCSVAHKCWPSRTHDPAPMTHSARKAHEGPSALLPVWGIQSSSQEALGSRRPPSSKKV